MKRQALVIGINRYPLLKDKPTDTGKHLHAPYHDAIAIGKMLNRPQENPDFSWCVENLLSNDGETGNVVSANELRDAIRNLFLPNTQTPPEVVLLFFAGHGLRDNNGKVYLAHSNVKPRTGEWGFPLDELRQLMLESTIPRQIVLLDCCHSGDLLNFTSEDIEQWQLGGNRLIIAAGRDDREARGGSIPILQKDWQQIQ
ncbi:caspase family protein [Kamptonema sp. UHCC 0994]|uniref:caspase family protein n=1 Tax=Kamptonema sp. UHCC 0994 TaxID=3031329 RepID=UPI0023B88DEA|nr:caspase family protein [Kamptonema sp. UHCC 0994]MDF0554060.1 caspase family protein [Kamptonema sp. UHCC 0994]